jgi:hypothetical protein
MKYILFSSAFFFVFSEGIAQNASVSAGSDASGTGGTVAYSLGQVVYSAVENCNQGVQQPYEFYLLGNPTIPGISMHCEVYPNPTLDVVQLKIETLQKGMHYMLFDASSKLLEEKNIASETTTISLASFAASSFFLRVNKDGKELQSFKILKAE